MWDSSPRKGLVGMSADETTLLVWETTRNFYLSSDGQPRVAARVAATVAQVQRGPQSA